MRPALPAAALAALLVLVPHEVGAQAPDVAGSRDHPLVGRYQGARIARYQERAFEEVRLIDKPLVAADGPRRGERNSRAVEGRQLRITYEGPAGRSALEMFRNHEQALLQRGFERVFACAGTGCGPGLAFIGAVEGVAGATGLPQVIEGQRYGLFRLPRDSGTVWVALYANERPAAGNRPLVPFAFVEVVEERPMQGGQIQFVDATQMGQAIGSTGKVALYGILFDFDRADIKPESKPTLEEIAKFLRANPGLGLIVAGHTDSQGGFDYNVELSRRRAAAVVAALTRDHGIAAARLTPFGVGPAAPVASNDTEEGRAKNRRVELVKR
jgi:outer membrane protein OmpA-like peptidoglycan-associated protein